MDNYSDHMRATIKFEEDRYEIQEAEKNNHLFQLSDLYARSFANHLRLVPSVDTHNALEHTSLQTKEDLIAIIERRKEWIKMNGNSAIESHLYVYLKQIFKNKDPMNEITSERIQILIDALTYGATPPTKPHRESCDQIYMALAMLSIMNDLQLKKTYSLSEGFAWIVDRGKDFLTLCGIGIFARELAKKKAKLALFSNSNSDFYYDMQLYKLFNQINSLIPEKQDAQQDRTPTVPRFLSPRGASQDAKSTLIPPPPEVQKDQDPAQTSAPRSKSRS